MAHEIEMLLNGEPVSPDKPKEQTIRELENIVF